MLQKWFVNYWTYTRRVFVQSWTYTFRVFVEPWTYTWRVFVLSWTYTRRVFVQSWTIYTESVLYNPEHIHGECLYNPEHIHGECLLQSWTHTRRVFVQSWTSSRWMIAQAGLCSWITDDSNRKHTYSLTTDSVCLHWFRRAFVFVSAWCLCLGEKANGALRQHRRQENTDT